MRSMILIAFVGLTIGCNTPTQRDYINLTAVTECDCPDGEMPRAVILVEGDEVGALSSHGKETIALPLNTTIWKRFSCDGHQKIMTLVELGEHDTTVYMTYPY